MTARFIADGEVIFSKPDGAELPEQGNIVRLKGKVYMVTTVEFDYELYRINVILKEKGRD